MLKIFIIYIGAILFLLCVTALTASAFNKLNCNAFKELSGLNVKSTPFNCYVITDRGPIEVDRYQLNIIYGNKADE
jgi:hypothetical protein